MLSAALAQAPESAAYGLLALAPLGLAFGPQAMALALLGAVVANIVAGVLGAGRLVSGPRAALSLVLAALASALVSYEGPQGRLSAAQVLCLLAVCVVGAGLLQVLFGALRLGSIVKFTPHPVRIGLTSGVGLLLIATAMPVLVGLPFGHGLSGLLGQVSGPALLVGLAALGGMLACQRWRLPVPPALAGLTLAALLQAGWLAWIGSVGLSAPLGVPLLSVPAWLQGAQAWPPVAVLFSPKLMALLGSSMLTLATLATLDSLLTASVVDGRLRRSRDANRELRAQGLSNMAAGLFGGQAGSPSVARSFALVLHTPQFRYSVLAYAAALLAILLFAPGLIGLLPASAIGGVLVLQGWQLISPTLWRTPWALLRVSLVQRATSDDIARHDTARRELLRENWSLAMAVVACTTLLGLGAAVLVGAAAAVLLFVRANMRDVVRRVRSGQTRRSLKMRPPEVAQVLQEDGDRIAVLELEGALFFGTADALRQRLGAIANTVDTAILDLHQVSEIDATGARILLETGEDWAQHGKHLVAAEWAADDPRRRVLMAMATPSGAPGLAFALDCDTALEQAEQRLLDKRRMRLDDTHSLSLQQTQLGRGLSVEELALLAERVESVQLARGTVLFRQGDPGDALFVSLRGHIGLRLPGSERRLASFAPGVTMGEMALLDGRARSAEAVAETDLVLLQLSAQAFEGLKSEHPLLAAKLLNNIALHLADRVRSLTTELGGWVNRASLGRGTAAGMALDAEREG